MTGEDSKGSPGDGPQLRRPLEHISDWDTRVVEASYSPKELCARCGFSMRHVQRFMLKRFKLSLRDYVAAVRMTKAYNLLRSGFTIKETAMGLGFKQVSHFCRCFRQHFNTNPSKVILRLTSPEAAAGGHDPQLELEFARAKPPAPQRMSPPKKARGAEKPGRARKKDEKGLSKKVTRGHKPRATKAEG